MIENNLKKILDEIKNYNSKLICVSKTRSVEEIKKVYDLGMRDFGENSVQELAKKRAFLPKDIRWHMIGHLQTNKVKKLLEDDIFLIHSVDTIKLAKEINKYGKDQNILLEVNIGQEDSKYGFIPDVEVLKSVIDEINHLKNINCIGLMCIAPKTDNSDELIRYFSLMKDLKTNLGLDILSMGMSNDYIYACKYESTYLRIGTAIFGNRDYSK